jgi:hypothetical protein
MGDWILAGNAMSMGLVPGAISLLAIGIYAWVTADGENDDDDSTPGGGLMQPVC